MLGSNCPRGSAGWALLIAGEITAAMPAFEAASGSAVPIPPNFKNDLRLSKPGWVASSEV
jgi:hypothetical protein